MSTFRAAEGVLSLSDRLVEARSIAGNELGKRSPTVPGPSEILGLARWHCFQGINPVVDHKQAGDLCFGLVIHVYDPLVPLGTDFELDGRFVEAPPIAHI